MEFPTRNWYFIAVRKDGNVIRLDNIFHEEAYGLFRECDRGGKNNFAQYGQTGEEHAENVWCEGATF